MDIPYLYWSDSSPQSMGKMFIRLFKVCNAYLYYAYIDNKGILYNDYIVILHIYNCVDI